MWRRSALSGLASSLSQDARDLEQKFTAMEELQKLIESEAMKDLVNANSFSGTNAIVPAVGMHQKGLKHICAQ